MKPYVDILGTRYSIEIHKVSKDEYMKEHNLDGYCSSVLPKIVLADFKELYPDWSDEERDAYFKQVLRHECTHAFLNSSGMQECGHQYAGSWAKNEEMVDWIAIQFPKMLEAFKWLECL